MNKKGGQAQYAKNSIHKVEIIDLTDLGFGVGRVGDAVIFISDTIPGDVVEARIIKVNSSFLVGRVEKYISVSCDRVSNRCSECSCKSCAYKNISYGNELSLKENGIRHIFSRKELSGIKTEKITASPKEHRYRNKAQYPVALINGEYSVGFFAPKSHRVTPVSDCPLTPSVFSEIIEVLVNHFKKHCITVYSEQTGTGLLRHIYLRRGEVSGEILLTLVLNGTSLPGGEELVSVITSRFPNVVGILLNVNQEFTNIILSDEYHVLFGRDYIFDTLAGVELKIAAPSFYQVNHDCAELLYAKARELAEPKKCDTVLDLYCGAGSIGLSMARSAKEVIGIEIVESAVECARFNAKHNGIDNAHFYLGDAADTENLLSIAERERKEKIVPDIVILDPPRSGSDEKLLRHIASLAPRKIVYISCNPKTLARDMAILLSLGYDANTLYPVDMFPMTGHVESLVCLTKQTN